MDVWPLQQYSIYLPDLIYLVDLIHDISALIELTRLQ